MEILWYSFKSFHSLIIVLIEIKKNIVITKFYYYHSALTGVKKLNDHCRRIHLQRSNEWDGPKDILLVGNRMEHLFENKRASRKYRKQEPEYWNMKIHESRAKLLKVGTEPPDNDVMSGDFVIYKMTAEEIKDKVKERGFTTPLRSIKELQELFLNTLREEKKINSMSLQEMYLLFQTVYSNYKSLILHDLLIMVTHSFSSGNC